MPDRIKYVKSSSGSVNSEFYGDDAIVRDMVDVLATFRHVECLINTNMGLMPYYPDSSWFCTDLIPIIGNKVIVSGRFLNILDKNILNAHIVFYDANGVGVGSWYSNSGDNVITDHTVTVPNNTKYMRVQSCILPKQSTVTYPHVYASVDWAFFNNRKSRSTDIDMYQSLITPDDTSFAANGKNLVNPRYVYPHGKYIEYKSGQYVRGDSNAYNTRLIHVDPSTTYALNRAAQVTFFDEYARFIGGFSGNNCAGEFTDDLIVNFTNTFGGNAVFTTPKTARYISMTIYDEFSDVQLEKGDHVTDYVPYTCTLTASSDSGNAKTSVIDIISKAVIEKKTIKIIGDSITAGVCGTGYDASKNGGGVYLWGDTYTNVKGVCWANMIRDYWEKKYGCTVLNYGYSGISSGTIVSHIDTLVEDRDDVIICMIGTNDRNANTLNGDLNGYIKKLQRIVDLVTSKGKDLILMASIPASVANEVDIPRLFHMEDVDNAVAYVASRNGMEYVSVYKLFIDYCEDTGTDIDSLLQDGLHPNDRGYEVMFRLISNALGIATKRPGATW